MDWDALFRDHPEEALGDKTIYELVDRYWAYDPMTVTQARLFAIMLRAAVRFETKAKHRLIDLAWRMTKGMR